MSRIYADNAQAIGNTPLVRLNRINELRPVPLRPIIATETLGPHERRLINKLRQLECNARTALVCRLAVRGILANASTLQVS